MGNREDLLVGARRCLAEKGYGRTTVRDIAAAADVSMAAIGYHFGSREALLNAAVIESIRAWGDEVDSARHEPPDPEHTPAERFEAMWTELMATFTGARRADALASIEAFVQAQHSAQLRDQMAAALREGRSGLTAAFLDTNEDTVSQVEVRTLGSVQMALLTGLLVQCLTAPEDAPTARELLTGLRDLVDRVEPADGAPDVPD